MRVHFRCRPGALLMVREIVPCKPCCADQEGGVCFPGAAAGAAAACQAASPSALVCCLTSPPFPARDPAV